MDSIYLDNNSTTPIDSKVLDAMMPFLKDQFANASSTHFLGVRVKMAIEKAKSHIADLIKTDSKQLIITSGATEAINLAFKSLSANPRQKHIITLQTEHKAVLDTCKYLENIGFDITYLPVQSNGLLELERLKQAIKTDTLLVSVMWVNNETGIIQDIKAISEICHQAGILFMTDATQAVGKIPIDVSELSIDFLALSGHKFYAPKGIGALYYSKKGKKFLTPQIHGGGQENNFRSGTINTAAVVGLGKACEIVSEDLKVNADKVKDLRDKLENELLKIEGTSVNGSIEHRIFNVSNMCFPNLEADILIGRLNNIALSSGSACTSEIVEPSYVLRAMGLTNDRANSSIRFSLSKFNTEEEIDIAIHEIRSYILSLQSA